MLIAGTFRTSFPKLKVMCVCLDDCIENATRSAYGYKHKINSCCHARPEGQAFHRDAAKMIDYTGLL